MFSTSAQCQTCDRPSVKRVTLYEFKPLVRVHACAACARVYEAAEARLNEYQYQLKIIKGETGALLPLPSAPIQCYWCEQGMPAVWMLQYDDGSDYAGACDEHGEWWEWKQALGVDANATASADATANANHVGPRSHTDSTLTVTKPCADCEHHVRQYVSECMCDGVVSSDRPVEPSHVATCVYAHGMRLLCECCGLWRVDCRNVGGGAGERMAWTCAECVDGLALDSVDHVHAPMQAVCECGSVAMVNGPLWTVREAT